MSGSEYIYELVMKMWPLTKVAYKLGKQPVTGSILKPFFSTRLNQLIMIPVNEVVSTGDSMVLPYFILTSFIEQASYCFIMKECMCRRNEGCQTHSPDIGCLFLGDGAALINPSLGSLSTKEMALAHVQSSMKTGLVPLIAHTIFDSVLLGVPHKRMLTICFCCECCCTIRYGLRLGPPAFWDMVTPLPGLHIEVSEECIGCAVCIGVCPVGALSESDGRAIISETCKGCGHCIAECPVGAISIRMPDSTKVLELLWERVNQQTDIGQNGK